MNIRNVLFLLFSFISLHASSQQMSISGNIQDTVAKAPLQYAVAMAVRIKDSVLVAHTRTDVNGHFEINMLIDTVEIIISHPKFSDQSFYIFGSTVNHTFDLGKVILPLKSQQLKEVVIYAFKDPVYYKGDTLIYTADSFKVKPNATVEDLLKKLPGIKVDEQGAITSQGKAIDQVLVDGDEFFGSDPTVATKNLAAKGVESVQVYEKKNEDAAGGAKETIQIMDLKLKEDAKKGYFGKVSAASDFQKFYEGELFANKYKGSQKIAVFVLGSNTPRSAIGMWDAYKYGLDGEMNKRTNEDGHTMISGMSSYDNSGIPKTLKPGFYYNDKLGDKTKLGFNYSYANNQLDVYSTTKSQFFLKDTNYVTENVNDNRKASETHVVNLKLNQMLDSLTELEIEPRVKINNFSQNNYQSALFLTSENVLTRRTDITNMNDVEGVDINTNVRLNRKFKKKARIIRVIYNFSLNDNKSTGILKSFNTYHNSIIPGDSINQNKKNENNTQAHNAIFTFAEPLTQKIKLEFEYNYNYSIGKQHKETWNWDNSKNEYTVYDSLFTNSFENIKITNRLGFKFIYESRKQSLNLGLRVRNLDITNTNLITQQYIHQSINNILPVLDYKYKFNESTRLNASYSPNSSQPSINQLQPIPDNSNPNEVRIGNPDLLPTFSHDFSVNYNTHKPISGKYMWCSANFSTTDNAFGNSITYDDLGRTITQTVNVSGNYNGGVRGNSRVPIIPRVVNLDPHVSFNYNNYVGYINMQKNITKTINTNLGLDFDLNLDTLSFSIGYNFDYNSPSSTLSDQSNKPYFEQRFNASVLFKFPFKIVFETDVQYRINSNRAAGYNINYILWNASVGKTFLKNENLILSLTGTDILNQNVSASRTVQDNVITDNKTNIVSRYFLLRLTFKFNNNNTKDEDNYFGK